MEIGWKVYITEEARRHRCVCGEFDGEHQLGRHHVINQVNIFDSRQGCCMEVYDPMNCGGSVDLIGYLEHLGLSDNEILYIEPDNISDEDKAINEVVRTLEAKGIYPVFDMDADSKVYIVPAVQQFNLVEFQVSDGPPNDRGTSFDVYCYSEAKRIFNEVCEKGWKQACRS